MWQYMILFSMISVMDNMTQQEVPTGTQETPTGENKKSSKSLRLISTLFMLVLIAVTFYITCATHR